MDLYSTAEVEEKLNNINLGPLKSRKAIEAVFKKFNIPVEESKNISLKIRSKIPVGKGMASSTADIGATIGATLGLIKKELSSEEIAKLASTIEPTDSLYIEKNSIFNPLNGEVIRYLGNVKDLRVVILEPNSHRGRQYLRHLRPGSSGPAGGHAPGAVPRCQDRGPAVLLRRVQQQVPGGYDPGLSGAGGSDL